MTNEEIQAKRAEIANSVQGSLDGVDCLDCLNRGYITVVDASHRLISVECKCMAMRRSIKRIERSGMKELMARYTMDNWQMPERWQTRAKELATQYAENPDGKWFVMSGAVGAGKSHLCTALAGKLINRGIETRYMLWRDVSVQAKAMVNDDYEYRQLIEPLKRVRALYIDDLFKTGKGQTPTVADANLAFEILNHRYNDTRKITIISSERSVEQMLEIDEAVGSRIYERSKGFYLPLNGMKNWRLK